MKLGLSLGMHLSSRRGGILPNPILNDMMKSVHPVMQLICWLALQINKPMEKCRELKMDKASNKVSHGVFFHGAELNHPRENSLFPNKPHKARRLLFLIKIFLVPKSGVVL